MSMRNKALVFFFPATFLLAVTGCTQVSSNTRRAGAIGLGAAGVSAVAYELGHRSPAAGAVGAIVGGAGTALAQGDDVELRQAGFDDGYIRGQSDAIKRQYFLRRGLEDRPLTNNNSSEGQTVYYTMPGPEVTADGRKLEPHRVTVRVVE